MNEENVAIRLKGFIESEGLTHSQFADRCGIPRPSLSQLLTGRNKKISDVIVGQIHQAFPELSVVWLLFGEGPMINPPVNEAHDYEDPAPYGTYNSVNTDNGLFERQYTNVNGLNTTANTPKRTENKEDKSSEEILELQREIEKMRRNPRKVTHITVYYDDSTFETFYPK